MSKHNKENKEFVKQHIVPVSYLKRFAKGKRHKSYYIGVRRLTDAREVKLFHTNIKDIGYVCNYYDVRKYEDPKYWEHYFSRALEPMYSNDFDRIIAKVILNTSDNNILDENDKTVLSKIICFQFSRVPAFINPFISRGQNYGEALIKQLKPLIEKPSDGKLQSLISEATNPDNIKDIILGGISDESRLQRYADILKKRVWIVLYNKTSMPFYTSDNPVIMYNTNLNSVEYADVGIAKNDTMLYFPMANRVMIQILPGLVPLDVLKKDLDCKRIVLLENDLQFIMRVNRMQMEHASKDTFMDPDHLMYIKANY